MGNLALFFENSGVELARAGYRHVEVGSALVLQVAASLKVEIDVIAEIGAIASGVTEFS